MEPTDTKHLPLSNGDHVGSSTSHPEEGRSIQRNVSISSDAALPSPTVSLTSSSSVASNYSDYSVDLSPSDRSNLEEGGIGNVSNDPRYKQSNGHVNNSSGFTSENAKQQSNNIKGNQNEGNNGVLHGKPDLDSHDANKDESEDVNFDEADENSHTYDDQDDIWKPPEAENEADNVENSVAALDDEDDECANGVASEWGMPSSLNSFEEGVLSSHRFKEEKQKAIEEVMNGKFKNLVSQLLRKVGVENCEKKEESWVDTVTLLAWQAASFVKPEAAEGKAMDPADFVKIKCIAAGTLGDSRLIKGLVFKKHAAHKHMVTKYKRPRLLLVKGILEPSASSGLSSFSSLMAEDKDNLAGLVENLQTCHPNVILVEKSASRDVLQKVLDLGITLVVDMKLHRLERIARCIGSSILSSDKPFSKELTHCDSLYFEKIVEELTVVGEGGKKPCKTLMFLEGCPTRLGCTILLMGTHSEELKKIKCVVQCAVVMAYHFLLETSFLVDQEAMFSTIPYQQASDNSLRSEESSVLPDNPHVDGTSAEVEVLIANGGDEGSSSVQQSMKLSSGEKSFNINHVKEITAEVAISNDCHDKAHHKAQLLTSSSSTVHQEPQMTALSTASTSIQDVLTQVSYVSPATYEDMSTLIDLNGMKTESQNALSASASPTEEAPDKSDIMIEESDKDVMSPQHDTQSVSNLSAATVDVKGAVEDDEDCIRPKDEITNLLDSESILVLMSSRNASKGIMCEQSHLSHIKFYRYFDVPLGKFLRDNLFKQTVPCKTCNELPEAHYYYYAHHNQQLTIKVKKLGDDMRLPGESEDKLWMWSRCGKCAPNKDKATKRVLISTAARGLSFGKFLELSFSSHSSINRLSSCGHSFQKDFLYFFGLGSMVALFWYSRVATYNVSVPAHKLEFNSPINKDWLKQEIEMVYTIGLLIFQKVKNLLEELEPRFSGQNLVLNGSSKGFTDIVAMLKAERSEFEESIKSASINRENSHDTVHKLLRLNWLRWEILLEACVWERRLQSLQATLRQSTDSNNAIQSQRSLPFGSSAAESGGSQVVAEEVSLRQTVSQDLISDVEVEGRQTLTVEAVKEQVDVPNVLSEGTVASANKVDGQTELSEPTNAVNENEVFISHGDHKSSYCPDIEIHIQELVGEPGVKKCPDEGTLQGCLEQSSVTLPIVEENLDRPTSGVLSQEADRRSDVSFDSHSNGGSTQKVDDLLDNSLPENRNILITGEEDGTASTADEEVSERVTSPPLSNRDSKGWIWYQFSQIREECMTDLHKGHLPKFGQLPKYVHLLSQELSDASGSSSISKVIIEEGSRVHIPLRDGDYVVSDFDGEISSTVACALALMKDLTPRASDNEENATLKRAVSEPSPDWSRNGSYDPDVFQSATSFSFVGSRFPSFDGLNNLDTLVSYGQIHPEVTLGIEKYPMKGKYSVVIVHANDFRAFRERCCPSELDYIASLSRCKSWDAKGGKSKSLFAKTFDDRLIVKEIKKTELDSFMKFAPEYFRHMKESVESGNQTCLAKVLGIYQVTIRNPKSGKETKHDLMVMENLSFGRNITRQYDLKGALHARFTATSDGTGDVLLDQNFVNDMNASPLYVGQRAKRLLQRAVWNDTTFLHSINVMDYSLLVGVDRNRRELLCGIIDYLRQYTWDKQLETWVKSSLVVPKNVSPTIISPELYKKRFRKFMDTHFLTVPDHWCSRRSSNPCKLCGVKSNESEQRTEKREELIPTNGLD